MRLLPFLSKKRSASSNDSVNQAPWADFWYQMAGAMQSVAGEVVNATTTQKIAACYACKTAIAESFAMLPASLLNERDSLDKVKDEAHPLSPLLREAPNDLMDSFTFFETMQNSVLTYGNAVAHKQFTKSGRILQILPLLYDRMTVKVLNNGQLGYSYRNDDGTRTDYQQKEIFHLRYNSKDGVTGQSPIQTAAEVFGSALAMQTHTNATFQNGAFQGGMLKVPFKFNDNEARANFVDSFKGLFGAKNAGKTGLLEQGADWVKIAQDNVAAQLQGLREFSVLEICRIYRVPPVFAQVMDKGMAFASVEQFAILFVQYTIQPWVTRWERALKFQFLREPMDADRYVRFNVNALLRGDLKSRVDAVVAQLGAGLKTINEGRHLLDDNAIDDPLADQLLLSNNLRPASSAAAASTPPAAPPADNPATDATPDSEVPTSEADTGGRARNPDAEHRLLQKLIGRMARRERDQLNAAITRQAEAFPQWANDFYAKHRDMMLETLEPATEVIRTDSKDSLTAFLDQFIESRKAAVIAGGAPAEIVARIGSDQTDWSIKLYTALES